MVRKLVPLEQLMEDAEQEGLNPSHLLVDPDDVCTVDPNAILELEENTEQEN